MDGLAFSVTVILPLLMVACKLGIMFSTWGLVMAGIRLVNALTRYIHVRADNEATHPR
ncbi:hypothetical protein [Xylella phage Cota]|uniref:Uncharacterized protein n=1 Tax=Xylella phage Cota TaxID=2699877 RepID=A0A6F8ZKJ8_9CAUD|nr:hypothetical protein [Xylella phage Cota]